MEQISETGIKELERQRASLDAAIQKHYAEKKKLAIAGNERFVGMTLKRQNDDESWSYYRIVSPVNNNEFRFHTLVFTLPIELDFSNSLAENELCEIESIGFLCTAPGKSIAKKEIDDYEKITNEEFFDKLEEWFEQLKKAI